MQELYRKRFLIVLFGLIILTLVTPIFANAFITFMLGEIVVFSFLALSFNIVYAYGRIMSFMQGAFFGIGAYAIVYASTLGGSGLIVGLTGAVALGLAAAAVIGIVLVRLEGHSATILTVVLGTVGHLLSNAFRGVTGAEDGLGFVGGQIGAFGVKLNVGPTLVNYYLSAGVLWLLLIWYYRMRSRRTGILWGAIAQNDDKANEIGINTVSGRWAMFVIAGGIAGLGGALYALLLGHVTSDIMDLEMSVFAILFGAVGGVQAALGPLVGAAVVTPINQFVTGIFLYSDIVVGVVLVLIALFLREGIMGYLESRQSIGDIESSGV